MNYETMTIESLAHDCFNRSGYAINKQDLISRITHLIEKDRTEQLIIHGVGSRRELLKDFAKHYSKENPHLQPIHLEDIDLFL